MKLLFITSKDPFTITAYKYVSFKHVFNEYKNKKTFYNDLSAILIGDKLHFFTLDLYNNRFIILGKAIAVNFDLNDIKVINERLPKY